MSNVGLSSHIINVRDPLWAPSHLQSLSQRCLSHTGMVPIQTRWVIHVGPYSCHFDWKGILSWYNVTTGPISTPYLYLTRGQRTILPCYNVDGIYAYEGTINGSLTSTWLIVHASLVVIFIPHEYHNQLTLFITYHNDNQYTTITNDKRT